MTNALYLIHCGFYEEELSDGIFEFHINIPIVAGTLDEAKQKVRLQPMFIKKKMHIDGIQEIQQVGGFAVEVRPLNDPSQGDSIIDIRFRDL
jgi:hypothetical protein